MNELKVCYAKIGNMGDLLNELIFERVFKYRAIYSHPFKCQTTGIGSGLNAFFPGRSKVKTFKKRIAISLYSNFQPTLNIWSTGFISYPQEEEIPIRKKVNVVAVRGELTKLRLEKILGEKLDVPTGDGGLLASFLVDPNKRKKYSVGIIPHFKERNEPKFQDLVSKYPNAVLIDLTADPISVLELISECEVILSSSLHGLIVADSFGIPNKRVVLTDKLMGDGYKFDDYYSSFNIKSYPFDLNSGSYPTINEIIDEYSVPSKLVEKKKEELIESFSRLKLN